MITLTTEQAQQIEEALEDIVRVFKFETGTPVEALAVIRAARAHDQAEQEPTSKAKALDYAILTLHSIACLTQGNNLLWWQKSARNALAEIDELLREQSVATYQEPASRAILCPPPPPEVYQMRSRDAYEAGWYEAQKQKAVSPIAPAQQAEQEPVAVISESAIGLVKLHSNGVSLPFDTPLYAAPVRTKDLTDAEVEAIMVEQGDLRTTAFARAVIAADREKNNANNNS